MITSTIIVASAIILSQTEEQSQLLNDLIQFNSYEIILDGLQISGPGSDRLLEDARQARYTLIAEPHNMMEINLFTSALVEDLSQTASYRALVLEQGPAIMSDIQDTALNGGLEAVRALVAENAPALHFGTDSELALMNLAVSNGVSIWGVDRSLSAEPILRHILSKTNGRNPNDIAEVLAQIEAYNAQAPNVLAFFAQSVAPTFEAISENDEHAEVTALSREAANGAREALAFLMADISMLDAIDTAVQEIVALNPTADTQARLTSLLNQTAELRGSPNSANYINSAPNPIDDQLFALSPPEDPHAAHLLETLKESRRNLLYYTSPQVEGAAPNGYSANFEREDLMIRNFRFHNRAAIAESGEAPRAIFKMGGWHIMQGRNPSRIGTLGDFAGDWAYTDDQDSVFISVLPVNEPGQHWSIDEYPAYVDLVTFSGARPDRSVVVHLEPLRDYVYANRVSVETSFANMIFAYDYVVLLGDTRDGRITWLD